MCGSQYPAQDGTFPCRHGIFNPAILWEIHISSHEHPDIFYCMAAVPSEDEEVVILVVTTQNRLS
jgi:hypothetical protein